MSKTLSRQAVELSPLTLASAAKSGLASKRELLEAAGFSAIRISAFERARFLRADAANDNASAVKVVRRG